MCFVGWWHVWLLRVTGGLDYNYTPGRVGDMTYCQTSRLLNLFALINVSCIKSVLHL